MVGLTAEIVIFTGSVSISRETQCWRYKVKEYIWNIYMQSFTCVLVWENEPKLKETTVNYFESRHHQSIEEYTRDNGELVNQDAKIVWASLLSSLEVSRYDCLFHDCPLAGNTRRLLEILSVILFGNLWCNHLQCRFLLANCPWY